MVNQIQKELATSSQSGAKVLFTWVIMEHF